MHRPAHCITPQWPAPANVRAVCSTRSGGVSRGAYESLNLGDHVGDAPELVAENRAIFERAIDAHPVYMKQVHGTSGVVRLDGHTEDGVEGDGCWTTARHVGCTIMVADCLPVLFAADDGSCVGAAHAGWRGLVGGIVEATARSLEVAPPSLLAWLGPCIGPESFEVGAEVKSAFEERDTSDGRFFKPYREGKWLADLPALARRRLASLGITKIYGNDGSAEWCTVRDPSRFFSHRRDRVSGRFAACIWLA